MLSLLAVEPVSCEAIHGVDQLARVPRGADRRCPEEGGPQGAGAAQACAQPPLSMAEFFFAEWDYTAQSPATLPDWREAAYLAQRPSKRDPSPSWLRPAGHPEV
jgi:hypothetical protein